MSSTITITINCEDNHESMMLTDIVGGLLVDRGFNNVKMVNGSLTTTLAPQYDRSDVHETLLDTIKRNNPAFFERPVVITDRMDQDVPMFGTAVDPQRPTTSKRPVVVIFHPPGQREKAVRVMDAYRKNYPHLDFVAEPQVLITDENLQTEDNEAKAIREEEFRKEHLQERVVDTLTFTAP